MSAKWVPATVWGGGKAVGYQVLTLAEYTRTLSAARILLREAEGKWLICGDFVQALLSSSKTWPVASSS